MLMTTDVAAADEELRAGDVGNRYKLSQIILP